MQLPKLTTTRTSPLKVFLFLFSAGLLLSYEALGEAEIQGMVTGEDGESIPFASIQIEGTTIGASTNAEGEFVLPEVPAGTQTLSVSHMGYQPIKREVELAEGEKKDLAFTLKKTSTELSTITIEGESMTGGEQGIDEIPGSASYISSEDLDRQNYTDINRVLNSTAGVNIQEEEGFGLRPNIGLRGSGTSRSSKVTIMEDGVLAAPAPYSAPAAYYTPTMGRMHSTEIMKGSSQIEHGPLTTGGAINFISTPIPSDFSGKMELWGGSHGNRNLHSMIGNSHENVGYMVETFQYGSNGFKDLDGGGDTGFDVQDFVGKVKLNSDKDADLYQSLNLKVGYHTETSNETYLGLTRDDFEQNPYRRYAASQDDQMNTEQSTVTLSHYIEPTDNLNLTTTAYRKDFERNWYKLDGMINPVDGQRVGIGTALDQPDEFSEIYDITTGQEDSEDDAFIYRANNREYYSQGIQSRAGFNFNTNDLHHRINMGARYHQDEIDRFQWEDGYRMENRELFMTSKGEPGTESNRIQDAEAFASFVRYQLEYGDFTFIPGIRYENMTMQRRDFGSNDPDRTGSDLEEQSNDVGIWMPGVGFNYDVNPSLNAFAGVHKGFAPPGANEETQPEESINYELGVRLERNLINAKALAFFNDYENLLGSDLRAAGGAGTTEQFNAGEAQTQGLELEVGTDFSRLFLPGNSDVILPFNLSYTFTEGTFLSEFESAGPFGQVDEDDEFPYLAKHQLSFDVGVQYEDVRFNLNTIYNGDMRTETGQGDIAEKNKIPSYYSLDVSSHYDLTDEIALFGQVRNALDETYIVANEPAGVFPGLPRTFEGGVKANF